ncbi:MAG: TonB-dependent receptor domain-containing protein, partial [Maricaulaceae bacterium]
LVPTCDFDRLQIITHGASGVYGADAVAGVANFLTRNTFEGAEFNFEYRPQVDQGAQRDLSFEGLFGVQGDRGGAILAVSFLDRTALTSEERPLFIPAFATSGFGNPGAFGLSLPVAAVDATGTPLQNPDGSFVVNESVPVGFPPGLTDPGCLDNGGTAAGPLGPCGFNFGEFFDLVPEEERIQGFASGFYEPTNWLTVRAELGYARNRTESRGSPTNPFLALPFSVVPANNPGAASIQFPILGGPDGGFTLADVPSIVTDPVTGEQSIQIGQASTFVGRPIGELLPDGTESEASDFDFGSDTFRASVGLTADLGDWSVDAAFTYAFNDFTNLVIDAIPQQFLNALNGFGGIDCPGPLAGVAPGEGPCLFFNPFSTALDGTLPNDPAVLDSFIGFQTFVGESELQVFDAVASNPDLFNLPAGPVGFATGFQLRAESLSRDFDAVTNTTGFAQRPQQDDFGGSRTILAGFAEASIPIIDTLELQVAGRIENVSGGPGTTANPKVALLYRPLDQLSLRFSYSTSFRAPSLFQTFGEQVTLAAFFDPLFPEAGLNFVSQVASGGPDIEPETSRAFNIGFTAEPVRGLTVNLDYFRFDFDDVIIVESGQALIDADPLNPDIIRTVTPTGPGAILAVNVDFTNAASVSTDGIDFRVNYDWDTRFGVFSPSFVGTYLFSYDLVDPFAGAIDGLGSRNGANFGVPTPQLRFNAGLAWTNGPHQITTFVRYIGSLENDEAVAPDSPFAFVNFLPAQATLDANYALNVSELLDLDRNVSLAFGGINLTGNDPPAVNEAIGFESRVFDPRGRILFVRANFGF